MALFAFTDRRWIVRREAVLAQAEALVISRVPHARHHQLLIAALAGASDAAGLWDPAIHLHLSPLIYAGLWGDESPAYPLAAAAVVAGLGQMLLHGQEVGTGPALGAIPPREGTREVGTFLLYSLPCLAVAALEAPPTTRVAMGETLAACLVRLTGGRHGVFTPLEEALTVAAELPATFAALSAQLAGAAPPVIQACRRLGHALAVTAEFCPPRDRGVSVASPPVLFPPHQAGGTAGSARARASPHGGRPTASYRQWALSALVDVGLLEPGRGQLREMIEAITSTEE